MPSRLPADDLDRLSQAVCRLGSDLGREEPHVTRALYALLHDGQPITAGRLAVAAGVGDTEAEAVLARLHNADFEGGAVVGFGGLTLQPTPHRLIVDGRVRYTWCAWDTLFLPVALGTAADVRSPCGHTGAPVRLRVEPTGVTGRDPDDVALAFVHPDRVDSTALRTSFCNAVHFVTAPGDTDRLLLDLDDAFELGRRSVLERCGPA